MTDRITEKTILVERRKPTAKECKENEAEIVFERVDKNGREYTIYGARLYESWEQWGAVPTGVLSDNCDDIENWACGL